MKSLLTAGNESVFLGEIEIPRPREGEILFKVTYVAQNPTDWKKLDVPAGRVVGCDFAVMVADSNGSRWLPYQCVAGWVHGKRPDLPAWPLHGISGQRVYHGRSPCPISSATGPSRIKGGHVIRGEADVEKMSLESTIAFTILGRPFPSNDDFITVTARHRTTRPSGKSAR
ncbi:Protein TOXD [Apiospora phragmitis]|uniref:Protein TOXD n=1 Tax=Apiospora phragmitis TaxID=2905665 RepID=A0ABR1UUV1_9PEZI